MLPRVRFLLPPPPTQGLVLELGAAQGGIPANVLCALASALGADTESLEHVVSVLDAAVPLDLRLLHGRSFALERPDGEHGFATLVGAYAVAGLGLAAAAATPAETYAILAHVLARLTSRDHGLDPLVTNKRLTEAGIPGGLAYLDVLVEALAVSTIEPPGLDVVDHWDTMLARPGLSAMADLRRALVERRDALRHDLCTRASSRALEEERWRDALTCMMFAGNAEAQTHIIKQAHRASPPMNLLVGAATKAQWADVRRLLRGPAAVAPPALRVPRPAALPTRFADRVKTAHALVFQEMAIVSTARPPRPVPSWTLTYAAVLYGQWSAGGTASASPAVKAELRQLLLAHGVAADDLDFPESAPIRVPLETLADTPPAPSVLTRLTQRARTFLSSAPPPPPPPPPPPSPSLPIPPPPPMDMMDRVLGNLGSRHDV